MPGFRPAAHDVRDVDGGRHNLGSFLIAQSPTLADQKPGAPDQGERHYQVAEQSAGLGERMVQVQHPGNTQKVLPVGEALG
jgi:hypothetical protein